MNWGGGHPDIKSDEGVGGDRLIAFLIAGVGVCSVAIVGCANRMPRVFNSECHRPRRLRLLYSALVVKL